MKRNTQHMALVLAVSAVWLGDPCFAQLQPQYILALRGVGDRRAESTIPTDLQVVTNLAYLTFSKPWDTAYPGGLEIFDVSDVASPMRVGEYRATNRVNAVRVLGPYAYLGLGASLTETNDPGALEIVDISNPANPVRVSCLNTPGRVTDIDVAGGQAVVTESTRWTGSNLLGALEIYDVSNPADPRHLATYDTPATARSIAVSGQYAYLADGVTDLEVIDISSPASPTRAGGFAFDERLANWGEYASPAAYIRVVGSRVYSVAENGMHVLDVSTPTNPVAVGGGAASFPYAFQASPVLVSVAFWVSQYNQFFLHVFDGRMEPAWSAAREPIFGWPRAIDVVDQTIFLAAGDLFIYELTDPPRLSISRTRETLILSWTSAPDFILQRTQELEANLWSNVPDSFNVTRIELPLTPENTFFRLFRPY